MVKTKGMEALAGALYAAADHAAYTAGGTAYTASFSSKTQTSGGLIVYFILPAANINGKTITKVGIADSDGNALAEKALALTGGSSDVTYQYMVNIVAEDD